MVSFSQYITENVELRKFKAGDKVSVFMGSSQNLIGFIEFIDYTQLSSINSCTVITDSQHELQVALKHLTLITPSNSKFNIGDWVIVNMSDNEKKSTQYKYNNQVGRIITASYIPTSKKCPFLYIAVLDHNTHSFYETELKHLPPGVDPSILNI